MVKKRGGKDGGAGPVLQWNRGTPRVPGDAPLVVRERYGNGAGGMLIEGDNYDAMHALKGSHAGGVDLIYIDPPYATGRKFSHRAGPRDGGNPPRDSRAYDDVWAGGIDDYLQMIYDRLNPMKELLSDRGSIYVHVDWRASHYVRVLMDEVFGRDRFQNEIVWCYREAVNSRKRWNRKHDLIFFYTKGAEFTFNSGEVLEPHADATLKKYRRSDENGPYRLMGRGLKGSPIRSARDVSPDWERDHPELTYRQYLPDGRLPVDYWNIDIVNQCAHERTGYATQKPESLIKRIVAASSNPGDVVADFFCGSGTLPAVASRLGRGWLACDASPTAVSVTRRRLLCATGGAGFCVAGFGERPDAREPGDAITVAGNGRNRIVVELVNDAAGPDTRFWAVDPDFKGGCFSPEWWSVARNRRDTVETKSPEMKSGGRVGVLISDSAGADTFFVV